MNQGAQLAIKVVIICAIFIPYKFIIMGGQKTSFLQDFLVAMFAYALAYGVIALIQRGKQGN